MDAFTTRDDLLVNDVQKMAELGKFDTEFVFYGCAYYENDAVWTVVSENKERIDDFIYGVENLEKLPTKLHTLRHTVQVAGGTWEKIVEEQTRRLAKQLVALYPAEYFAALTELLQTIPQTDAANELLSALAYQLDGVSDAGELYLFQGMLEQAHNKRVITEAKYYHYKQWLLWERRDLANIPVKRDKYAQIFYGFAYYDEQMIKICLDGSKGNIYKKWTHLQSQKSLVSPIAAKQCWYNNTYSLIDARNDCLYYFQQLFSVEYMGLFEQLQQLSAPAIPEAVSRCQERIMALHSDLLGQEWQRVRRQLGF